MSDTHARALAAWDGSTTARGALKLINLKCIGTCALEWDAERNGTALGTRPKEALRVRGLPAQHATLWSRLRGEGADEEHAGSKHKGVCTPRYTDGHGIKPARAQRLSLRR